jgi:hypothetical protein
VAFERHKSCNIPSSITRSRLDGEHTLEGIDPSLLFSVRSPGSVANYGLMEASTLLIASSYGYSTH